MEKRQNDFILRNFYDKAREIAEQTYDGNWLENTHASAVERKSAANSKVNRHGANNGFRMFTVGRSSMKL